MSRSVSSSPDLSEQGVAMLELAMVLPFILLIVFGAIETKRFMAVNQQAQVLMREAASASFRGCSDFLEPEGEFSDVTLDRTQRCVVELLGKPVEAPGVLSSAPIKTNASGLQTFADSLNAAPGTSIIVSVFRYNAATGKPQQLARIGERTNPAQGTVRRSRFTISGRVISGPVVLSEDFIRNQQRIVVVEVYAHYRPLVPSIPLIGRMLEQDVYETAVL